MMIIIEGTDGVGKTTLAEKLAQELGWQYRHLSRLPDSFHRFFDYIPMIKSGVVQDRFHMSEIAYCHGRNEPIEIWKMQPAYYIALDRMLISRGVTQVLITADEEFLREQFEKDKQDEMYKFDVIRRANEAYYEIATSGRFAEFQPHMDFHCHIPANPSYWLSDDKSLITRVIDFSQAKVRAAAFMATTQGFNLYEPED